MPTLDWIGKKAVVNHHREVPFHLLEEVPELSFGDKDSGNMLIQGDNLVALKALLPYYAGKVKCIYIDPPYNTGNESWVYSDSVKDPKIIEWLGKTVGKEAEDLSRHDKWLCMMYPRIKILKDLLSDDGAIFVSLDDVEIASLRMLLDEVFGKLNFVATIIWQKIYTVKNSAKHFSDMHDYIVVYAKKKENWQRKLLPRSEKSKGNYSNPDNDERGPWTTNAIQARNYYSKGSYKITSPKGREFTPPSGTYWRVSEENFHELNLDNRIWWGKDGNATPRIKRFLSETKQGIVPSTMWFYQDAGHNAEAKSEVRAVFSDADNIFNTPKPEKLVQMILQVSTDKNDIVLDSFLGSGTTCAVAEKMGRRWIGVEMGEHCKTHCQPRLKKVVTGEDQGGISENVNWAGGDGFRFYCLGTPLFDESGKVYKEVSFSQLARHVYFTETGFSLEKEKCDSPLIEINNGCAVYLLFNGVLKDKRPNSGNVLTRKVLAVLPPHDGPKVIYGTACRLSPVTLREQNIVFKQIPYKIKID